MGSGSGSPSAEGFRAAGEGLVSHACSANLSIHAPICDGDSRRWGGGKMDNASFGDWQARTDVEPDRQYSAPKPAPAHYDLSAAYLELRYGAMDHAGRARSID